MLLLASTCAVAPRWDLARGHLLRTGTVPAKDAGELLVQGKLVLAVPHVATQAECAELVSTCSSTAALIDDPISDPGLVRLPTAAAATRAIADGTPCAAAMPTAANVLCEEIMRRALQTLDAELPSIGRLIFGEDHPASLYARYAADELRFTKREPACNVYTAGGRFLPHKDYQALTCLVSLSPLSGFVGGGTGFWADDCQGDPSLILRPPEGTALFFGGQVCCCPAGW